MQERLQKILSQAGVCSRREAEKLILEKKVKVNGKIATLGTKASFEDEILVNNKPITQREELVYFVLNKPKNTVCTLKDNFNRVKVTDLIDTDKKIFPVGRLDYDTTGVLLLTNDGKLSNLLTHPSSEIKRIYRARISAPLKDKEMEILSKPVIINNQRSTQEIYPADTKSYYVVLHQGSYHHVKKLFELVDKKVLDLNRVEFANITVKNMQKGQYRRLTLHELKILKMLVNYKEN
ncbi:ribosomal large subunit pseudouridine synthase B [Mycoplasma synoviae GX11-T]|nr:pseudouridine synthase [Mycoplasmopsis synoviae]MBD5788905.1 ribosomal large subunit pseudouridine synthase B [Mycoplasmopsis synoviae GX11-T]